MTSLPEKFFRSARYRLNSLCWRAWNRLSGATPPGPSGWFRRLLHSKKRYEDEIAALQARYAQRWLVFRRPEALVSRPGVSKENPQAIDDHKLVSRIQAAYKKSLADAPRIDGGMWAGFFKERHQEMHDALMSSDVAGAASILRDPSSSDLFYGFDNLYQGSKASLATEAVASWHAQYCYDGLVRLAEAAGVVKLDSPEAYGHQPPAPLDPETILERLDKKFGFKVSFPNPYPHEHGIGTSRGVAAYRVPPSIYLAWRSHTLTSGLANRRVVEIGAGLGRTAYYARQFGISDYTIVDIPFTSVSQAYFLGRVLGEDGICLYGETFPDSDKRVKIIPAHAFLGDNSPLDLVANADSLPEMTIETARAYWSKIKQRSKVFLSINHEANIFTVHDLIQGETDPLTFTRNSYWMRQGYTEEIVWFGK